MITVFVTDMVEISSWLAAYFNFLTVIYKNYKLKTLWILLHDIWKNTTLKYITV